MTNTTPQNNYNNFLELFSIYEKSIEENDIEKINELSEKIFNILPFKNADEKEKYLNILQSFKFWDDFKNTTFEIAQRLKNPVLKKSCFNVTIKNNGKWINQKVNGFIFSYCGLNFGIYNAKKNKIEYHHFLNEKYKYIIIELETGLSIEKDLIFLKDFDVLKIFNNNYLEKISNRLDQLKNETCIYNNNISTFNYFKNICNNNININL